mmetsp:Transcript_20133/g.39913  ORF Transcript_20133/g.39913 Transcript_20133/m.39913 type:complete len:335 (+) Transcript_20133:59-1063(+)
MHTVEGFLSKLAKPNHSSSSSSSFPRIPYPHLSSSPPSLLIYSWNVLHRVHAQNYRIPEVQKWPDEPKRLEHVTGLILTYLRSCQQPCVICLQEVSGDVLKALKSALATSKNILVFEHQHRRIPRFWRPNPQNEHVVEREEYIVSITKNCLGAQKTAGFTYRTDAGKSLLGIKFQVPVPARDGSEIEQKHSCESVVLLNTHLRHGGSPLDEDHRDDQLRQLVQVRETAQGSSRVHVLAAGDFNSNVSGLPPEFMCSVRSRGDFSLSRLRTRGTEDIDQVFSFSSAAQIVNSRVIDVGLLSDHNLVSCSIEFDNPASTVAAATGDNAPMQLPSNC